MGAMQASSIPTLRKNREGWATRPLTNPVMLPGGL
jgi:hypothetical protein